MFLIFMLLKQIISYTPPISSKILECQSSCLDWISPQNCRQCVYGYFLFTIKQDIVLRGVLYKQGSRTCVPCPTNQQVKPCEAYTSYQCTECLQNYDTWENTMTCSRNYIDINNDQTVFKPEITNTIFYLIVQYNGSPDSSLFITEICEGCKEVCFYQTVNCRLAAPKYLIFQAIYVSCGDQYFYDSTILGCNSCSNNCKVCSNSKQCQQCQPGYATYFNNADQIASGEATEKQIVCQMCEPNCLRCAFVLKSAGQNLEDQNNLLWSSVTKANIINYIKICYECLQKPGQYFLPQIDRSKCIQCQSKCSQCEYVCDDETDINKKYPTRQNSIYTFKPDQGLCKMRCRACLSTSQTFTLAGDDCEICSSRCSICQQQVKSSPTTNSLVINFTPYSGSLELNIACLQCEDGYYLNFISQGCLPNTDSIKSQISNCASFIEISAGYYICTKCATNYELQDNRRFCGEVGSVCPKIDINCKTCTTKGCQECNLNYYPKFYPELGFYFCSLCTEDYSCRQCSEFNSECQSRPDYYENKCNIISGSIGYNLVCQTCKNLDLPFLGKCVQCGSYCEKCQSSVLSPYCQQCLINSERKTTNEQGTDCIQCPPNTNVCDLINLSNPFYDQQSNQASNSITCKVGYECDQSINTCVLKNGIYLVKNTNRNQVDDFDLKIIEAQNNPTNKVTNYILESSFSFTNENYDFLQTNTVSNVTFVLNCNSQNFETTKLTTISTLILQKVSVIKNFKLVLQNKYSNSELIQMQLNSFIIFEYVNHLEVIGFNITREKNATDQQFGFKFQYNQGLKVEFKNCIFMLPKSNTDNLLKFYFYFLNLYDFTLRNVQILNLNYENSIDKTVNENIFQFEFDDNVKLPYVNLNIQDTLIYNCSFQSKSLFQIFEYKLSSSFDNQKVTISGLNITLTNFSQLSGFLYQVTRNQAGSISMNNIWLQQNIFDNTTGLVYVDGVSDLIITNIQVINCNIQQTRLIYSNTLNMANSIFQGNTIGINSQLFYSSYESQKLYYDSTLKIWKGLDMIISNIQILSNTVSYGNSLLSIRNPTNPYNIKFNVSISQLTVYNTIAVDFLTKYQATSGHIAISQAQNLVLNQVNLTNNYQVTIFYLNLSINIQIQNTSCTTTDITQQSRHCLFLDNDFEKIDLYNVSINNLFIQDGSAIAISSWKTDVLKTTNEQINITKLNVNNIKIQLVSPQVPNAPLMIKSEQIQKILLDQLKFQNNQQVQENQNQSISASPGILIQSPFCELIIQQSSFKDHVGFGSPISIIAGSVAINSIIMQNSNWFADQISVQYGGHLNVKSQILSIQQSQFSNSKALYGGFLYYSAQGIGQFEIQNCQISNSSTQISGSYLYSGGLIYVAHNQAQLNMNLNDLILKNITSEHSNIYIQNQQNQQQTQITIQDIDVSDVYAQSASLINVQFPQNSQFSQTIKLNEISIQQSEQGLRQFLKHFNSLQIVHSQFIQISYGNVYLSNIVYSNFTNEGLFQLVGCQNLFLDQITIVYGFVVGQDMIQIKESNLSSKTNISLSSISIRNLQNLNQTLMKSDPQYKLYLPVNQSTILRIKNLDRNNKLDINNIKMQDLQLPDQQNALIDIEFDQQVPSLIKFNQLVCSDSQLGSYGCVAINPNNGSDLIQPQSNSDLIRRRLLQNYSIDIHVYIIYTKITNIHSEYASFLFANQVNIQLTQVACQGNIVDESGGCIYLKGSTYDKNQQAQLILDTNNSITGNTARQGGGIMLVCANVNNFNNKTNQVKNNNSTMGGRQIDNGPFNLVVLQNQISISDSYDNKTLTKTLENSIQIPPGISFRDYYQGSNFSIIFRDQFDKRYNISNDIIYLKLYNTSCQLNKQQLIYNQTTNSFDLNDLAILCNIDILLKENPIIDVEFRSPSVIYINYSNVSPFIATEVKFNFTLVVRFMIVRCPVGYELKENTCKICPYGEFLQSNEPHEKCIKKNDVYIFFANNSHVVFQPGYYNNTQKFNLQNLDISFFQCKKIFPLYEIENPVVKDYYLYNGSEKQYLTYNVQEKCLGGNQCQTGYCGVMCQDCDRNKHYVRYKESCILQVGYNKYHHINHPFEIFILFFMFVYLALYWQNNHMVHHKSKFLVNKDEKTKILKVFQYYNESYTQLIFSGILHMQLLCIAVEELNYQEFSNSYLINQYGNMLFMPFIFQDNNDQINSQKTDIVFYETMNTKIWLDYIILFITCLSGTFLLYIIEMVYNCLKGLPYNPCQNPSKKKFYWRLFNALQLMVYMAFPSLLQILLKFHNKIQLGNQTYLFLYPNVEWDGSQLPNRFLAVLILYLYIFITKSAIHNDKINQLFFDSIFSTQFQYGYRYLNEFKHLILQICIVCIFAFRFDQQTQGSYAIYNYNQIIIIITFYFVYLVYCIINMPLKRLEANGMELIILLALTIFYCSIFSLNIDIVMNVIGVVCIVPFLSFFYIPYQIWFQKRNKTLDKYILKLNLMYHLSKLGQDQNINVAEHVQLKGQYQKLNDLIDPQNENAQNEGAQDQGAQNQGAKNQGVQNQGAQNGVPANQGIQHNNQVGQNEDQIPINHLPQQ